MPENYKIWANVIICRWFSFIYLLSSVYRSNRLCNAASYAWSSARPAQMPLSCVLLLNHQPFVMHIFTNNIYKSKMLHIFIYTTYNKSENRHEMIENEKWAKPKRPRWKMRIRVETGRMQKKWEQIKTTTECNIYRYFHHALAYMTFNINSHFSRIHTAALAGTSVRSSPNGAASSLFLSLFCLYFCFSLGFR